MAEKGFGVKEVNLIGASGTPTITSPNNLNLNANNVAISTNVSIGGTLTVTGNVSVGGTLTYEDVTSIDSVGIVTARTGVVTPNIDVDDFVTVGSNIQLGNAGVVTATTFSGSAASLTNLPVADSDIQVAYTVTANGSSAYRFAGNGVVSTADDPDLYLIRGQKYRFINNSGGSHPFQIRESDGGTAYSTGVTNNGAASGNIDFAPTFDSPAQLVYQCTSHGGMVGNIYLKDGTGNETNVGVTTFSGLVHLNQLKKASGTLDYLAATHNFANAAGSTNYFTVNTTDANLTGSTDGVLNLDTTDARGSFIRFKENGTTKVWVGCGEGLSLGDQDDLGLRATDKIIFRAGSSESMRIDSNGKIGMGSNSPNSSYRTTIQESTSGHGVLVLDRTSNIDGTLRSMVSFERSGTAVGTILCSNSATQYNTSSDHRLKENVVTMSNATDRLKQLQPKRFNFILNPDITVDGFLAHEVQSVVPEAISGTKDEVDSDNNPVYQQIDQSKIVPLLTAALQEAITKIETLEAEVAALKAK